MKINQQLIIGIVISCISSLIISCLNRQFVKGRSEIVSVSDSTLNDSSIFVGYVYTYSEDTSFLLSINRAQIWIVNSGINSFSDLNGYYNLKTIPGTYTIRCQDEGNGWSQLIEELKNVKINKNEKIQINFYLGYTIE